MFEVPMYDFSYDADRQFFDSQKGTLLHNNVMTIYKTLKDNFVIDFESITEENTSRLQEIRKILHSDANKNSRILYHLIKYNNINVRRSNKVEETNILHLICACGTLEDLKWYLNEYPKVKVNTFNHIQQTPLQFSIALGNSPDIAWFLYHEKGARLYPENSSELLDDDGEYTVVDALITQWHQHTNMFYSMWGDFGDLICQDYAIADLLKRKLPEFYSYLRSDMVNQ